MTSPTILLAGGGAVALFAAILVFILPSGDSILHNRLRNLGDVAPPVPKESAVPRNPLGQVRHAVQSAVGSRFERTDRGSHLADRLARADLKVRPTEWVLISIGAAAVGGALLYLRFGAALFGLIGVVLGYAGAQFFVRFRQSKRTKAFNAQLSPTILQLSGSMKAGYTFAQAIDLTAKNMPAPMGSELGRVTREVQLGLPMNEALSRMVRRNDSEDLRLLLIAVQIQSQVGGNLAHILDTIEFTVRERVRIKGEIKSLTGQARAQGWVLICMPFGMAGILMLIAPSYFDPMLQKTAGQVLLGVAGFLVLCGYGLIRRLVNIKI
ncbi:MAG: type II secretion system F family protein [Candidatus Dormibacteria bacterium]|jgi:tight adherence protein B